MPLHAAASCPSFWLCPPCSFIYLPSEAAAQKNVATQQKHKTHENPSNMLNNQFFRRIGMFLDREKRPIDPNEQLLALRRLNVADQTAVRLIAEYRWQQNQGKRA